MKSFNRLNKGFLLTIIVILGLGIYIIGTEISRNKDRIKIENICREYLEFEANYTMLPEKYRELNVNMSQDEFSNYENEVCQKLKKYASDNSDIFAVNFNSFKNQLDSESYNLVKTTSKTRKLMKVKSCNFDNNQVTVEIEDLLEKSTTEFINPVWNKDTLKYEGEKKTKNDSQLVIDVITLKKEKDGWKIIYSEFGQIQEKNYVMRGV